MIRRRPVLNRISMVVSTLLLSACTGMPDGTQVITNFEANRYLGQWYEIARLDHSFERNLDCVTATYSWRDDGGIRVINRGTNLTTGQVKEAEGRAYPMGDDAGLGRLKVSFFGPFYGGYNILALADDYQWSLVAGPDHDYLWILSRTPTLPAQTLQQLIATAQAQGFAVDDLIMVKQESECATNLAQRDPPVTQELAPSTSKQ